MNSHPSVVIISTNKQYSLDYEPLLIKLYNQKISLFCVWGQHAESWEDAMDDYIVGLPKNSSSHHVTTTSHPDEPLEDVINMAKCWQSDAGSSTIEMIEL